MIKMNSNILFIVTLDFKLKIKGRNFNYLLIKLFKMC